MIKPIWKMLRQIVVLATGQLRVSTLMCAENLHEGERERSVI